MLTRRSGAPSRFLIFRSAEYWAITIELLVFNGLFGFLPLFCALYFLSSAGVDAAHRLARPDDPIHVLARPLAPEDLAAGMIRAVGRVRGHRVCIVQHEHREKSWVSDWLEDEPSDATLEVERGEGVPAGVQMPVAWSKAEWQPRLAWRETDREQMWRRIFPRMPAEGRVREACVTPGVRVFFAGCRDEEAASGPVSRDPSAPLTGPFGAPVRGCGGANAVLTIGDTARLRIASLAADHAFRLSSLGVVAILALLYAWRLAGARPIALALLGRLRRPRVPAFAPRAILLALSTPLFLLGAFWLLPHISDADGAANVERWGWAALHFVAVSGVVVGVRMLDRAGALGAAIDVARSGKRPPLDRLREGEAVASDASIEPDAPLDEGRLTGKKRAHWFITATRVYKANRNYDSEPAPSCPGPAKVPVRIGDGLAWLDLTHVAADIRAVRRVVPPRKMGRRPFSEIVPTAIHDSTYVLEERFLDRREKVHFIGRVIRFEQGASGARVPVIGGTPNEPLVLHAGSRRSLLRGLRVERDYLAVATPLAFAVTLGAAALCLYLSRI